MLIVNMEFKRKLQRMTTDTLIDIIINTGDLRLFVEKFDALMEISGRCNNYHDLGFIPDLVLTVFEKKTSLLKRATTIKDCAMIRAPSTPIYHPYSGSFETDEAWVPEEELILWSSVSKHAILIPDAVDRYFDLFQQVFHINISDL